MSCKQSAWILIAWVSDLRTHLFFALLFAALVLLGKPPERELVVRRQSLVLVALKSCHASKLIFLLRPEACPPFSARRRFNTRAPSKWRA
jgi:hypothetical protein